MHSARPVQALRPPAFGRRAMFVHDVPREPATFRISDDLKLFAATFLGGFVFVSILLA